MPDMSMSRADKWSLVVICALLAMVVFVQLGIARGRDLERRKVQSTVEAAPAVLPTVLGGLPLRCTQEHTIAPRKMPTVTIRPLSRIEAEARYHAAKMYLETAEAAGLWNDRGERATRLAVAILLEVLVCRPGETP